jgi:DNA-binding transcriptional ArsR family regulator
MSTDVFAILADPTRRHLVEVLGDGEASVHDLVNEVDVEQPGVSRHLRILRDAGFVRVRAIGQRRLYSLRPEPFQQLEAWVSRYARDEVARIERLGRLVNDRTG